MKRSGGSRSFRTLGSRMRAFGRSLMRHYVPPQDMPDLDGSSPGWQSAAEEPLLWPESAAPNVAAAADEAEIFDAPDDNAAPATPRPVPARPTPAAPPPPQAPVQRKPAASSANKVNPALFDMLAKHDAREAERKQIRETKLANFEASEIQRQADPDAPPIRRRGRMSVDYVETGTLTQGDDTPPRPPKPAAPESSVPVIETTANDAAQPQRDPAPPIQRQPEADDGAALFEDWNTDDDDPGDDNDGGTPPALEPTPPPMTPPGIVQRFPDEATAFEDDQANNFEAENDADDPQNFADMSIPLAPVETRRPQQAIQRDFQPGAPEAVDEGEYFEADAATPEDVSEYGYETDVPEIVAPPVSPSIQRQYQPTAPEVPNQTTFQQTDFNDALPLDLEDGDTRPMPIQRVPELAPPSFDDDSSVETGYESLSDWVDAHSDMVMPTPSTPNTLQRDRAQTPPSVNYDRGSDGAGDAPSFDLEEGDTRPMTVQRDVQPLPSPFDDDVDFEPTFDAGNEVSYDTTPELSGDSSPQPPTLVVQRQAASEASYAEPFAGDSDTFEVEAEDNSFNDDSETPTDDNLPEQSAEAFTWSGDTSSPAPSRPLQRQAEIGYDENFAADTDNYEADDSVYPAPEYNDENEAGGYTDFDVPQQRSDENSYGDYRQPETNFQAANPADFAASSNTVQRQPDAAYDDNFAVENTDAYEADAADLRFAPNISNPDETVYDDFNPPGQPQDEGSYSEFNPPQADYTPETNFQAANPADFAAPSNTVQRQAQAADDESFAAEAAYDEAYAADETAEYHGEAEEYIAPVYSDEFEADSNNVSEYRAPEADFQVGNTADFAAPANTVQRQPETAYNEAYTENTDEFFGGAEEYIAPVYSDEFEADSNNVSEYRAPEADFQAANSTDFAAPSNTVQRQPETAYDEPFAAEAACDEPYADDTGEFDVNDYAAPVYSGEAETDSAEYRAPEMGVETGDNVPDFVPPTNTVQRQPAAPEMAYDLAYGDSDVSEDVEDTGDYTYHRRDEGQAGETDAPEMGVETVDYTPPSSSVQRQVEASYDEPYGDDVGEYVDDDDDSSLYDSNYQAEQSEFVPAARNIDTPFPPPADHVQRSEQPPSSDTNNSPSLTPFYGDDVYETDISALLRGQPDPRPVQRRAELPDLAPETAYAGGDADEENTGDASVDLYQAMLQTGMVTPDIGFDNSPAEAAPQSVQRVPDEADDQADDPPLDLFQAMMETGMVQAARDDESGESLPDDVDAADDEEPMSQATRMDLLSFLDMPSPAPRDDVKPSQASENISSQVYQPPQPTNRVQRALNNEEVEQPEQPEQSEKEADVDVDQLARDVYSVLRNRLRIERERRDRNP